MIDSFARYGLAACTLWVLTKTPADESELYSFRLLSAMTWFNKKLLRIVKSYNLSEDDMFAIRAVFDSITGSYDAEFVRVSDLAEYMHLSKTKLFEWVLCAINPGSKAELNFTEYVYLISYYPMFAKRELNQFLFGAMDETNKMYLTYVINDWLTTLLTLFDFIYKYFSFMLLARKSSRSLLEFLVKIVVEVCENGAIRYKCVLYKYLDEPISTDILRFDFVQYDRFKDKKLDYLFMGGFHRFVEENPSVLWQAQYIQV